MKKQTIINFIKENLYHIHPTSDIYFHLITIYLSNLTEQEQILQTKKNLSKIKKSIKHITQEFDEDYLLIKSSTFETIFFETHNKNIINSIDKLIELLNQINKPKLTKNLHDLKTKLELGHKRYFEQNIIDTEKTHLIEWFSPEKQEFELHFGKKISQQIEVISILNEIQNANQIQEYDKIRKYLKDFPTKIFKKENLDLLKIQESLFFDQTIKSKNFSENKIITQQFDNIEVAVKMLELETELEKYKQKLKQKSKQTTKNDKLETKPNTN